MNPSLYLSKLPEISCVLMPLIFKPAMQSLSEATFGVTPLSLTIARKGSLLVVICMTVLVLSEQSRTISPSQYP